MNLVTATAVAYESILLGVGRNTKSGGIITSVAGIIIGIFGFIYISREITRNEEKKRRMTKRINAVITYRERKDVGHSQYCYIYTFTGLDEYEGVTFYDESLLLTNVHVKGEIVTLLINEHNLEEFWFEEAERISYRKNAIVAWAIIFLVFVVYAAFLLSDLILFGMIM